jgi:hypothetical protein
MHTIHMVSRVCVCAFSELFIFQRKSYLTLAVLFCFDRFCFWTRLSTGACETV